MALGVEVTEESLSALPEHARIPIEFDVESVFDVDVGPCGRIRLAERRLALPYRKDYDAVEGGSLADLARTFDLSRWGLLSARIRGERVGGILLAFDTPDVHLLEGRSDLAVVWDLRVAPGRRRRGVGAALWDAAAAWARALGCRELEVETQNVNVPACRFYAARGCVLRHARTGAYPALPEEVQLLWYAKLA